MFYKVVIACVHREYDRESADGGQRAPFALWLRERCAGVEYCGGAEMQELTALSSLPSTRACSFRSMTSFGSHYRIEGDELGELHVTYDCGVAELQARVGGNDSTTQHGVVDLIRVGTLKDILVLNYANMNVVLMVVSWVAKDTEAEPRMRRDSHGFWIANLSAHPRCSRDPYILPSLASQVLTRFLSQLMPCVGGGRLGVFDCALC